MEPDEKVDITALAAELARVTNEVKGLGEDLQKKYASGASVTEEAKQLADRAISEMNGLKDRLNEAEQKLARPAPAAPAVAETLGQRLAKSQELRDLMDGKARNARIGIQAKDITSARVDADGSAGALLQAQRIPGIVAPPQQRLTMRSLLAPGNTNSHAIQYVRETGFTNKAAPVAEGAAKPESSLKFDDVTLPVQTLAHWTRASKQILADAPQLASYIDQRLRYGLALKEEGQLLHGDGTGTNLHGLVPQAKAYSAPFVLNGATGIDLLRLAMLQSTLAEYPATGIVLNHLDWAKIELSKDSDGRYIIGNPQQGTQPTLWGLPVVATASLTANQFLTGAFGYAAQIFDREDAVVDISTEDGNNFTTNRVTIRCEERLVLAVYRPEAFVYGAFS